MPKLYFRYGTMNSSKTANLLMVAHNYEQQDKKILLIKPKIASRINYKLIASRVGISRIAHIVLTDDINILNLNHKWNNIDCILVDEAQFLTKSQIDQLREITRHTPVICYGLKTDYRSKLFPGSKRLLEIADNIEEIKTVCVQCPRKSIINMKCIDGKVIKNGSSEPDVGFENKYTVVCWHCWSKL